MMFGKVVFACMTIVSVSEKVTDFLIRQGKIETKDKDICRYGVAVAVSSLLNLVIILSVGLALKSVLMGVIFLAITIFLRQFTGGYHADSYLKCNVVYDLSYVAVFNISNFLYERLTLISAAIPLTVCFFAVLAFSPVENKHKNLTAECKRKHKRNAVCILLIIYILMMPISDFSMFYFTFILVTVSVIVRFIIFEILRQRRCGL
jgi:accessory gene regulator B